MLFLQLVFLSGQYPVIPRPKTDFVISLNYDERRDTYRHLFDWHEVGALSDAVKDLGQLRVDEGII